MKKYYLALLVLLLVTAWSAYHPFSLSLWFMEMGICLVGVAILIATFRHFRFTNLTYCFIFIHIVILLVGAHYSYARVPLFDWIRDLTDSTRNSYDKVGHFFQGFAPAFIVREILIRKNIVQVRSWVAFLVIAVCLSISAFYELIEWWSAGLFKQSAEDFLGTQGYQWDTQSDMFLALLGASVMLIFFSKWQDKQIRNMIPLDADSNH